MDELKRSRLIDRLEPITTYNGGFSPKDLKLFSIDEYFDGADNNSGIFCNTELINGGENGDDRDAISLLRLIEARPNVSLVRIAITQCDDGEWPFSDTILVVTSASEDEVVSWFPEGSQPDECSVSEEPHVQAMAPASGHKPLLLWFD